MITTLFDHNQAYKEAQAVIVSEVEAEVKLPALGEAIWLKERKSEPPPTARPTFSDLRAYIEGLGEDDRESLCEDVHNLSYWLIANSLDRHKGKNQICVPREVIENEALVCYFRGFLVVDDDGVFQEVADFENLKPFAMVAVASLPKNLSVPGLFERIDAIWLRCREAGYTGRHPFRTPVRALQKDVTAVQITEALDTSFPVALRLPFGAVSVEEIEAERDYHLPVFEPFDAQLMLDLGDVRINQLAKYLPIRSWLMDWNLPGKTRGGHGGRVPLWLRLFLEVLVCADRFRFYRTVYYELAYLYALMFGDVRWDIVRVRQLRWMIDVASRAVVVLRDGSEVSPVNFKYFEGLERDSKVFVEVAAVRDSRGGALTAIGDLRDAYRSSNAVLQAYLSASEYLDRVWTRNGRLLYETVPVKNSDGVILDYLGNPMTTQMGKPLKTLKNADKEIVEQVMREPNPRFTPLPVANDEMVGVCWVGNSIPKSQRRSYKKRALEIWGDLPIINLKETEQDNSFIHPSQAHRNTHRAVKKASEQAKK